jgi:hypothetical protein
MFCFLPSLMEASRAAWCGAPLEMKELLQGLGYYLQNSEGVEKTFTILVFWLSWQDALPDDTIRI